ncbi:chaperone protein, partial [Haematococcus lacustris]
MVMADYLTFLRKYALNELAADVGNAAARLDNIQWCLTVPAMWSEGNKALMRRASFVAGLIKKADSDALTIILEPEAAALHALDKQAPPLVAGMSVMVLDVGGGTADATVHNCQALGGQVVLSEATCAEGALCGSVYVDKEFRSFYRKAVGEAAFDKWAKDDRASLQQVMQEWEKIKCSYASNHASGLAQSLGQLNLGASEPNSTFT